MKIFKLKPLNTRGDTIVEVMIVLAVLGFAFATSTSIATRSLNQSRTSEEHSQALGMLNTQVELLRAAATAGGDVFRDGEPFCISTAGAPVYFASGYAIPEDRNTDVFANYPAPDCGSVNVFYNQSITYDSTTGNYVLRVRWDGVSDLGKQQEVTSYRTYKLSSSSIPTVTPLPRCSDGSDNDGDLVADTADPGCHGDANAGNAGSYNSIDNDETNSACSDGSDNDSDTKVDFPADLGCVDAADNNEAGSPPPALISPGSFVASAWHMFNVGGTKKSQVFQITNPITSDSALAITSTSITGPNASSFQIISNSCANTIRPVNTSCFITVQFYPPSGPSNNRLGNAGTKTATLTVSNSNGVGATTASLSGMAVSDRIAPDDTMYSSAETCDAARFGILAYNSTCYNDAFACSAGLFLWGGGNLVLYPNVAINSATWSTGATGANRILMQGGNGNLVMFRSDNVSVWNTGARGAGAWLMLYSDSALWIMNPNWQTSSSGNLRLAP